MFSAIQQQTPQGNTTAAGTVAAVQQRRCPQLSYSLAKRLVDLMVEPMSFDRIGNLGNSSTMKARLQEEVRLAELAQSTTVRYTEMGVFSAVAGGN